MKGWLQRLWGAMALYATTFAVLGFVGGTLFSGILHLTEGT